MNTTPLSLATLENAFFKNLHNQPAAEELHLIHHKSGPPSPDGARSKAFFPAEAGGVRIFFWTILVVLTLSLSSLCILLDSCRPR